VHASDDGPLRGSGGLGFISAVRFLFMKTLMWRDARLCTRLLGPPAVTTPQLMEWCAAWVETGGRSLGKPTKFERTDGRF